VPQKRDRWFGWLHRKLLRVMVAAESYVGGRGEMGSERVRPAFDLAMLVEWSEALGFMRPCLRRPTLSAKRGQCKDECVIRGAIAWL